MFINFKSDEYGNTKHEYRIRKAYVLQHNSQQNIAPVAYMILFSLQNDFHKFENLWAQCHQAIVLISLCLFDIWIVFINTSWFQSVPTVYANVQPKYDFMIASNRLLLFIYLFNNNSSGVSKMRTLPLVASHCILVYSPMKIEFKWGLHVCKLY